MIQKNQQNKLGFTAALCAAVLLLSLGYLSNGIGVRGAASGVITQKRTVTIVPIRDDAARKMRYTQLSNNGIDGLVDALEARGAKVELMEQETNGISSMQIKVDGIALSPVVTSCRQCEPIVFEY